MHLSIPTRTILNHRGIPLDSICPLCDNEPETLIHCLFNCNRAKAIWNLMVGPSFGLPEEDSSIFMWSHDSVNKLGIVIPSIMWSIWCARNAKVFDDISMPLMAALSKIEVMTRDVTQVFNSMHKEITSIQLQLISWKKCHLDSYILNVDGSAQTNPEMAGFGGLIRDFDGQFMRGFHGNIGYSNILHVEILALIHGIQICWDEGLRDIICYTDFMHTIHLVQYADVSTHDGNDIAIIRKYMAKDWTFQLRHTLKEGNMCADFLAKVGTRSTSDLLIVLNPPAELRLLLMADSMGVVYHHG